MKRRTARKVIKYGMKEVRGRYGTYLKAIQICPRLSNFLHFKKIMRDLRDIYDPYARPKYQATTGRVLIIDSITDIEKAEELLSEIRGKTLLVPNARGIGKTQRTLQHDTLGWD